MTGIILRKVIIQRDIPILYHMMTAEDQFLFSVKIKANSEQQFREWFCEQLKYGFHDFYMIVSKNDDKPIGYAHNYDFSLQNGHCKIVTYLVQDYRDAGIGGISTIMFIDMLFKLYPLRKVYTAIYNYNQRSLFNNQKAGFTEEGVLNKYRYYHGEYHALHIMSIDRQTFYRNFGGMLSS